MLIRDIVGEPAARWRGYMGGELPPPAARWRCARTRPGPAHALLAPVKRWRCSWEVGKKKILSAASRPARVRCRWRADGRAATAFWRGCDSRHSVAAGRLDRTRAFASCFYVGRPSPSATLSVKLFAI